MFDNPIVKQVPDVEGGYAVAQKLAEKSIVLLKNEHDVLPLNAASLHSVVLIGGHADVGVLTGGGSAQVDAPGGSVVPPPPAQPGASPMANLLRRRVWLPSSPLRALTAKLPSAKVTYVSGDDLAAAASAAKAADVAIVFGYQPESEGMDLKTLDLGDDQDKLIETVAAANAKTIVVLETGSPATMPWIDKVAGVVEAWYPGIRGAEALANLLTGEVNPSGKLAITFPKSDADLPHPTLVLPPPESQPQRPAPGADISSFHGDDGQRPAALSNLLRREAEGRIQVVRRREEAGAVPVRLRSLLHKLCLLRIDREERRYDYGFLHGEEYRQARGHRDRPGLQRRFQIQPASRPSG